MCVGPDRKSICCRPNRTGWLPSLTTPKCNFSRSSISKAPTEVATEDLRDAGPPDPAFFHAPWHHTKSEGDSPEMNEDEADSSICLLAETRFPLLRRTRDGLCLREGGEGEAGGKR